VNKVYRSGPSTLPCGTRSVRRGVVMVKQPGMFSQKIGATSLHVSTQSPQNVAVEPGIHSLTWWDRCFALPQLLYGWRHQSGIFFILPLISLHPVHLHGVEGEIFTFLKVNILNNSVTVFRSTVMVFLLDRNWRRKQYMFYTG
jgi:hypothetical protein